MYIVADETAAFGAAIIAIGVAASRAAIGVAAMAAPQGSPSHDSCHPLPPILPAYVAPRRGGSELQVHDWARRPYAARARDALARSRTSAVY